MTDPYTLLGVTSSDDDATIRRRYLELVRKFPPEQFPEKFIEIRAAFEIVSDVDSRVRHRVFDKGRTETIERLIQELSSQAEPPRIPLQTLLKVVTSTK
jgi:curved DNA-binding protein CbpA